MRIKFLTIIFCLLVVRVWGEDVSFGFREVARIPAGTAAHSAVVLANGDVLVVGGLGKLFGLPLAVNLGRVYDVQTEQWRVIEATMTVGRIAAGVVLLTDGKVLIAGGYSQDRRPLDRVEIFDPEDESFTYVGKMRKARARPRLNLLADGRVLISGDSRQCEIFERVDGACNIRFLETSTHDYHKDHAAVTLADGSVLLVGGRGAGIERFEPASETYIKCKARLPEVIDDQAAMLLFNGKVLLAGGQRVYSMDSVDATWLYDPQADRLEDGPKLMPRFRGEPVAGAADVVAVDLFSDDVEKWGRFILLCGGEYDPGREGKGKDVVLDFACVYDVEGNRLMDAGRMLHERDEFAGVALPPADGDARVLLIGGYKSGDKVQSTCELFWWQAKQD